MELRSLQSPSVSCSIPRSGFLINNPVLNGHFIKFTNSKIYPDAKKLSLFNFRAQASGQLLKARPHFRTQVYDVICQKDNDHEQLVLRVLVKKLVYTDKRAWAITARSSSVSVEAIPQGIDSKDENIVFVAGATGKVGSRTVRELLKLGCKVRAGVRSIQRAENLVKSVRQMKLDEGADEETQRKRRELLEHRSAYVNAILLIDVPAIKKLELVECDLEKKNEIGPAIANASVVICCIGASEKEISDITGPYRIDYLATKNLIDAATAAKVNHFILVTSLGTNKFGFPAAILNLFWGVLCWKRKAEEALLGSGIPYTIVRPGGMERPTDSYKETHNLTLSLEDTLFGGQVSNLQVAELLAFMAKNRSLSYCKVVEVIAETTAPLTPMGKLLEKIPPQRVEVSPPKEPPSAADGPETSAPIEKESIVAKETATRPLSPYFAYDDLKPPTSPCPTAPGNVKAATASTPKSVTSTAEPDPPVVEMVKGRPLSPYSTYPDLKPPCSPCPTPSGPKEAPSIISTLTEASDAAKVPKDPPLTNYCHSPFAAYEDLKPPSSPCPTPSVPKETPSIVSALAASDTTKAETASVVSKDPPPLTNSCHSPFPAYEDLKPPTFPTAPQKK